MTMTLMCADKSINVCCFKRISGRSYTTSSLILQHFKNCVHFFFIWWLSYGRRSFKITFAILIQSSKICLPRDMNRWWILFPLFIHLVYKVSISTACKILLARKLTRLTNHRKRIRRLHSHVSLLSMQLNARYGLFESRHLLHTAFNEIFGTLHFVILISNLL